MNHKFDKESRTVCCMVYLMIYINFVLQGPESQVLKCSLKAAVGKVGRFSKVKNWYLCINLMSRNHFFRKPL